MQDRRRLLKDIAGLVEVDVDSHHRSLIPCTRNGFDINAHGIVTNPRVFKLRPIPSLKIKSVEFTLAEVSPRAWMSGYDYSRGDGGGASGCGQYPTLGKSGCATLIALMLRVAYGMAVTPSQISTVEFRDALRELAEDDLSLPTLELT